MSTLCHNRLIQTTAGINPGAIHNNRITNLCALADYNITADHRLLHRSVDLTAVSYDGAGDLTVRTVILRRKRFHIGINLPVLLIQIELRHDVNQLHVRFPVRGQCSDILPVAIEFICKKTLSLIMTVRDDVLAEIQSWSILVDLQSLLEGLPGENINSHGRQIAARMLRLLLEVRNLLFLIGDHNAKTLRLFHGNRHDRNGNICVIFLMKVQHGLIVHLVNMIP